MKILKIKMKQSFNITHVLSAVDTGCRFELAMLVISSIWAATTAVITAGQLGSIISAEQRQKNSHRTNSKDL